MKSVPSGNRSVTKDEEKQMRIVVDWDNYRNYFRVIEKIDTDYLEYYGKQKLIKIDEIIEYLKQNPSNPEIINEKPIEKHFNVLFSVGDSH
jgi:hypothetical protein